jgi:hypothetical protein
MDSPTKSAYHIGFMRLLQLLTNVLADTTNDIKVAPRSLIYRFLLSELLQAGDPSDLSIITFNYDLLLERTLESVDMRGRTGTFVFPGCYRMDNIKRIQPVGEKPMFETEDYNHTGVALLKLHGSMNWQSTHTSRTPTPAAMFSTARKIHVLDSPFINKTLTWKRKARTVYMKPVIVPPVSGKRGMIHNEVLPLWTHAAKALREAERIVIAGYSCPSLDLEARILLSENLSKNKTKKVYIIDPNPAIAATYMKLCGVDHATVYASMNDWVRDARH